MIPLSFSRPDKNWLPLQGAGPTGKMVVHHLELLSSTKLPSAVLERVFDEAIAPKLTGSWKLADCGGK